MSRPLDGVRVLELGQYISGPYCSMLLADQGAEVIKIERPTVGDPRRRYDPLVPGDGVPLSGGFVTYNRNKKSVTLDLQSDRGRGLFRRLVSRSDVIVENLRPGLLDKLGLGYESLLEANARLIYCAISGYGRLREREGPYTDRPAFDAPIQAMSGIMSVIGNAGDPPITSVVGFADIYTAVFGALSICMALYSREHTGQGAFIDQAMYDTCVSLMERSLMLYSLTGHIPTRGVDQYAPVGALEAKDGYVAVIIPTDEMWRRFCEAIERPDLLDHPDLRTVLLRSQNFPSLIRREAEKWTVGRLRSEIVDRFTEHGLPAGEVQTVDEIFVCPQLEARRMFVDIAHPRGDPVRLVRTPFTFWSGAMSEPRVDAAPDLGENTDEVLADLLGISADELEVFRVDGVV